MQIAICTYFCTMFRVLVSEGLVVTRVTHFFLVPPPHYVYVIFTILVSFLRDNAWFASMAKIIVF